MREPQVNLPLRRSLKGKSALFLVGLFAYCLGLAAYVLQQKGQLVQQLDGLNEIQAREQILLEADLAASSAITDLFVMPDNVGREAVLAKVHQHFNRLQQRYTRLLDIYPQEAGPFRELLRKLAETVVRPSPQSLAALREDLAANKERLQGLKEGNRALRQEALQAYLAHSDRVALVSLVLAVVGLVFLGIIVAIFFGRLTRDLLRLQQRVAEVVRGYRGGPLSSRRKDELGQLIQGVNALAGDLYSREQELEIERQKRFHLDKMGTIGHVAAGVVHEVGNPVAAIQGLAQEAREALAASEAGASEAGASEAGTVEAGAAVARTAEAGREDCNRNLELILDYAQRLQSITQDLAALNQPRGQSLRLLDINDLIRGLEKVLHYDERWYGTHFELSLESGLPAVSADADQLSQLLMNLLVNSCEALERVRPLNPRVRVTSRAHGGQVRVAVEDNGVGMTEEVRRRAFEAFFTTKEDASAGLGLLLCASIASAHGGHLELPPQDSGCRVDLVLPLYRSTAGDGLIGGGDQQAPADAKGLDHPTTSGKDAY